MGEGREGADSGLEVEETPGQVLQFGAPRVRGHQGADDEFGEADLDVALEQGPQRLGPVGDELGQLSVGAGGGQATEAG